MRLACPSCSAPMVGTRAMVKPLRRASSTSRRHSAKDFATSSATVLFQPHFEVGSPLGIRQIQLPGKLQHLGTRSLQLILGSENLQFGKGSDPFHFIDANLDVEFAALHAKNCPLLLD